MMLEQEIEKYLSGQTMCNCDNVSYRNIKNLILGFAEPREKRIEELIALINAERKRQEKCDDIHLRTIADLEKENAELKKVAEFQQSSNMSRHFENKKLKEGLAIGSTFNKALNSMNKNLEEERDKYRNMVFDKDEQLTKAQQFIRDFLSVAVDYIDKEDKNYSLIAEGQQLLNEVEK